MKVFLSIISLFFFQFGKCQFTADFFSNRTIACVGTSILFTSFSNPIPATSWHWDFGDGNTSNVQNPTHYYSNFFVGMSYTVTLIAGDGIDFDTITKSNYITMVSPSPKFGKMEFGTQVNFYDSSSSVNSNIVNWFWDFGDGSTSSLVNPIHVYQSIDSCYDVTLSIIDEFFCVSNLTYSSYICVTGINENSLSNLSIYPNPTTSNITINLGEVKQSLKTTITNSIGQVILTKNYNSTNYIKLDLGYTKGVYFLTIETQGEVIIKKFVIE